MRSMHTYKGIELRGSPKIRAMPRRLLQFILMATARILGIISIYILPYYLTHMCEITTVLGHLKCIFIRKISFVVYEIATFHTCNTSFYTH